MADAEGPRAGYTEDLDVASFAPSPIAQPRLRLLETELDLTGLTLDLQAVATPLAAASVLQRLIGQSDREHFVVLLLDNKHRLTHAHVVSRGTAQTALVHPREVFKAAILANATALIIGHNHPSGILDPSPDDKAVSERIQSAGKLLGIAVLDSLIVGPSGEFYASSLGATQVIPGAAAPTPPVHRSALEKQLAAICRGLMLDIDEVLERQGEDWWDETVTSGTHNRQLAERHLGLLPYRPLGDGPEEPA